ncbi:MAG: sigma-70 family RNA polymerase sigma factor [Candidatus Eremiobacteraeota bacterium]|nr:sigma-70 family RNA polymerase sigma factor [Candidatus Eremiobacteraeota bacterium]MBV8367095.1 sigma-70 family RNA polymerase sigma factor [Candidatus Eremiobacteraeota bacterium]
MARDVTDEQVMAALALSDLRALDELYDRYARPAYALAYRIVGERGAAEDVVQDAFLSAWRQAKSYRRERGNPRTWLMAIVHHRAIDRIRASAASSTTLSLEELPDGPSEAPGVWQQVWAGLRSDAVRQALDQLPPEQKKSLELAYFSGYTQSQIAELMGVPLGTVKGRMRMGLQKLRAWLETPELGLSGT